MSIWGNIGKIALKAAPYAAMAIPGVGVPLGMAIGGITSAASKKAEGGSWKDALLSGGIGAASGAVGAGALKGIGPTSSGLSKFLGGMTGKTAGTGVKGIMGKVATDAILGNVAGSRGGINGSIISDDPRNGGITGNLPRSGGGIGGGISDIIQQIMSRQSGGSQPSSEQNRPNPHNFPGSNDSTGGQTGIYRGNMDGGLGPVMGRRDQNVPNLAESIGAGRQDAIRNQPFRNGYDQISYGPEPADDSLGNIGPEIRTPMPPIYPNAGGRRRRTVN